MAIAGVLLLAHAVSVLSQPVPSSSDQPGCTHLIVTTVTGMLYAYEQSWLIEAGSQILESEFLADDATVETVICVEAGTHSITLLDSFADGWSSGSSVKIDYRGGGSVLAQTTLPGASFSSNTTDLGDELVVTFDVLPQPAAPPAPPPPPGQPPNPPGVKSHETCHLEIRGVRGGGDDATVGKTMMQLAEVTIYDPTGEPLPVLTSSSDCEPNDGETITQALDGNTFSKWLCGPTSTYFYGCDDGEFDGATLDIEFDSSRVVGSYTLTTANDHP